MILDEFGALVLNMKANFSNEQAKRTYANNVEQDF